MPKQPLELTDLEIVAISKAFGDARVAKARAEVPNDSTALIDFTIRVTGSVSRGVKIEDTTKQVTDKLVIDFTKLHAATLKKIGVKQEDYDSAYDALQKAALKKLKTDQAAVKPRDVPVKGRDGDITAQIDVEKKK